MPLFPFQKRIKRFKEQFQILFYKNRKSLNNKRFIKQYIFYNSFVVDNFILF